MCNSGECFNGLRRKPRLLKATGFRVCARTRSPRVGSISSPIAGYRRLFPQRVEGYKKVAPGAFSPYEKLLNQRVFKPKAPVAEVFRWPLFLLRPTWR